MRHELDKDLANILDTYAVPGASPELMRRLVAETQTAPNLYVKAPLGWLGRMDIAVMALAAVVGFWLGSASLTAQGVKASSSSSLTSTANLNTVILGPKTWQEVML